MGTEPAPGKSGAGVLPLVEKNRPVVLLRSLNNRVAADLDTDGDKFVVMQAVTKLDRCGPFAFPNLNAVKEVLSELVEQIVSFVPVVDDPLQPAAFFQDCSERVGARAAKA